MPPTELIGKRTRNSKTCHLGGRKYSWDGTIGSIHYKDNPKDEAEQWKEIDNIFEPVIAPWDWQMLKAGYHIRVKEDFTAGQIIEFEKQEETVQFQPMALEWTNDIDQIQQISMPVDVAPVITNPEVDLLLAVGMLSHQGTIRWDDSYGEGIDFEWRCSSTRLVKRLEIENLNKLPIPEQYILDGGNPVLRLNLIFDPSGTTDIYIDGAKWNESTKKQTSNIIEFRKDGEVLWGFMPLRYWDSSEDEGHSVATLEKRGNKFYISIRVPYEWLQNAIYPVFIDTDVDETVAESADDCVEASDGTCNITHIRFIMGDYNFDRYSGARFASVTIPDGAIIGTAYLTWTADLSDTGAFEADLYGEDTATPAQYASIANNITNRTKTTAVVQCDSGDLGNWSTGVDYNSPSIVSIIEELMASYSYAAGAPMAFISWWNSGTGERVGRSWDDADDYPPRLHIEYTAGGASPESPAGLATKMTTIGCI